jgi:predicted kinase
VVVAAGERDRLDGLLGHDHVRNELVGDADEVVDRFVGCGPGEVREHERGPFLPGHRRRFRPLPGCTCPSPEVEVNRIRVGPSDARPRRGCRPYAVQMQHRPATGAAPYHRREHGEPLRRPLLVVVSGVPGGGKTTLAHRLAAELRLPHLNRDLVRDGIWATDGVNVGAATWDIWLAAVTLYLRHRVSVVVDQTMYRGLSDVTIARELAPISHLVNVHVSATNARARYAARTAGDVRGAPYLDQALARFDEVHDDVAAPMDFGGAQLLVDTTDPTFPIEPLAAEVWEAALSLSRPA